MEVEIIDLLSQESHREGLVEQPQLAALALLIVRISENAAVQKGTMHVGNHGSDVASTIGGFASFGILDGVEIVDDWRIEVFAISFVD